MSFFSPAVAWGLGTPPPALSDEPGGPPPAGAKCQCPGEVIFVTLALLLNLVKKCHLPNALPKPVFLT